MTDYFSKANLQTLACQVLFIPFFLYKKRLLKHVLFLSSALKQAGC